MHNMADFEALRQHRNQMAREVGTNRLGRKLRAAGPKKNLLARLAGRFGRRASGAPQAAG
jgi:hypothetical protein